MLLSSRQPHGPARKDDRQSQPSAAAGTAGHSVGRLQLPTPHRQVLWQPRAPCEASATHQRRIRVLQPCNTAISKPCPHQPGPVSTQQTSHQAKSNPHETLHCCAGPRAAGSAGLQVGVVAGALSKLTRTLRQLLPEAQSANCGPPAGSSSADRPTRLGGRVTGVAGCSNMLPLPPCSHIAACVPPVLALIRCRARQLKQTTEATTAGEQGRHELAAREGKTGDSVLLLQACRAGSWPVPAAPAPSSCPPPAGQSTGTPGGVSGLTVAAVDPVRRAIFWDNCGMRCLHACWSGCK